MGGNPSVLDEVNAEGPPVLGLGLSGVARGIGLWDVERAAAVDADLARDVNSDFDECADRENAAWDALAGDDGSPAGGQDARASGTVTPPEPDDFNAA
jgi:hypothetical protein